MHTLYRPKKKERMLLFENDDKYGADMLPILEKNTTHSVPDKANCIPTDSINLSNNRLTFFASNTLKQGILTHPGENAAKDAHQDNRRARSSTFI